MVVTFLVDQGKIRESMLAAANASVKHLFRSVTTDTGEPVTDESEELQAVIMVLDQCLRHAFKGRASVESAKRPGRRLRFAPRRSGRCDALPTVFIPSNVSYMGGMGACRPAIVDGKAHLL